MPGKMVSARRRRKPKQYPGENPAMLNLVIIEGTFLGAIGFDRIYMGQILYGMVKALLFLICVILVIFTPSPWYWIAIVPALLLFLIDYFIVMYGALTGPNNNFFSSDRNIARFPDISKTKSKNVPNVSGSAIAFIVADVLIVIGIIIAVFLM